MLENKQLKTEIEKLQQEEMQKFSEINIDEHIKTVLTQKNNKIENMQALLLDKEKSQMFQQQKLKEIKQELILKQNNLSELKDKYKISLEQKNKYKKYIQKLKEKLQEDSNTEYLQTTEEHENDKIEIQNNFYDTVQIDGSSQTSYFSPLSYILSNKQFILNNETNLEEVKSVIDVLCKLIGFENIEDLMNDQYPTDNVNSYNSNLEDFKYK